MSKDELELIDPFGKPHAAELNLNEIKEQFFHIPNMQFAFSKNQKSISGSFAITSRRGGGKTHLLRKIYADYLENNPEPLVKYEGMTLSTDFILDDVRHYHGRELNIHLYRIWRMVFGLRIVGLYYHALRQGVTQDVYYDKNWLYSEFPTSN